jgi:cobalt/nickel transport system permease protein
MVHIADGILAPEIWVTAFILAGIILAYTLHITPVEKIPELSLVTSAVFVASLIHVPIGPTSVHLLLIGLAGILLGLSSFPSIFIAVVLQAFLFQHGGITTIGINTLTMGTPALMAYVIFRFGTKYLNIKNKEMIFGGMAGGTAVAIAVFFASFALYLSGEEFIGVIIFLCIAHIPVIIIEVIVVGSVVVFLKKVKPEMLGEEKNFFSHNTSQENEVEI